MPVADAFLRFPSNIFCPKRVATWYADAMFFWGLKCPETMASPTGISFKKPIGQQPTAMDSNRLLADHFGPSGAGNHGIMQEVFCDGTTGRYCMSADGWCFP